jgi:hypothetical protein
MALSAALQARLYHMRKKNRLLRIKAAEGGGLPPAEPEIIPFTSDRWRLTFSGSINPNFISVSEVEFNGVQATGGTPVFSSQFDFGTYSAARAFDGVKNSSSAWATSQGAKFGAFLGYIFAEPLVVSNIVIQGSFDPEQSPSGLAIEYSATNDGNWTQLISYPGLVWTTYETKTFNVPDNVPADG